MANNNLRSFLFWAIDRLKGRVIHKRITQIKRIINSSSIEECEQYRRICVNKLIKHALESCLYYKSLGIIQTLEEFPIINKTIIRADIDSFISNRFKKNELISIVTSGSTGTPFQVYHDVAKRKQNSSDTLVFAELAGFNLGDILLYLKIWSASNKKSNLLAWLQNVVPFDVFRLGDDEMIRLMASLRKKGRKGILGYASALEQVCKFLDQNPNKIPTHTNLTSALSMSESLSDYTKEKFKEYFGVDLFARYSNLENGILAQQFKGGGNGYRINTASYVVEIFKMDEDVLVDAGEMGRIVITDLYNFGMPMIRYDTGDIGRFKVNESGMVDNTILEHIEGRKLDLLYDTRGQLVSSYIMYKNMWKYTEISQYQLIQSGEKDYLFKINVNDDFKRELELKDEFISYLGDDANFQIEYVTEIPLLSSGKRKKIINTYYNVL